MISKKRMRESVIDIFHGAGVHWDETCEYFEDFTLEGLGNAIQGLEKSYELPENTRLRFPWNLSSYDDPDDIVELLRDALEHDLGK